jgi:TrpR-related protein YerC/YecD
MNKWCEKEIVEAIEAIADCEDSVEVCGLFDVILTPREINDMARRYKIIRMLDEGCSYGEITRALGVSTVMISKVSSKIGYGFRRSWPSTAKKNNKDVKKWQDPLTRPQDIYYKGVPSPGTMLRSLKKK